MTIAETIYEEYRSLPRKSNEFYGKGWYALIKAARKEAIEEESECPDSYDSSLILTFKDGSAIYVANPKQACYDGFMRIQ